MEASQIIIEPILSEKTNELREAGVKQYTFRVATKANKHMILKAIEELFSVKPVACNTIYVKGKPKRSRRTRAAGNRSSYKKAIVTMKKGDKIDALEVL